ncbi:MAG: hypothetical protein ACI97A_002772 [Planctomycetota bacterium]|jgi:hypothetical protein
MTEQKAPEASFLTIIYTMATQSMIALGEIANPITKTNSIDERQARWHLKSIRILDEKTRGNLTEKEEKALTTTLKEIEIIFASKVGEM